MQPRPGEVIHFSEDPAIERFEPHVAVTAQQAEAYVWAVDAEHAPSYWFPRDCPRAMAWRRTDSTLADLQLLGPSVSRVHMIEYRWLERVRTTQLWAYRFDARDFGPFGDGYAQVATHAVTPIGPVEPVGALLALHAESGIELRVVQNLWPWWQQVAASTLGFSGIRLRNATPPDPDRSRPAPDPRSA